MLRDLIRGNRQAAFANTTCLAALATLAVADAGDHHEVQNPTLNEHPKDINDVAIANPANVASGNQEVLPSSSDQELFEQLYAALQHRQGWSQEDYEAWQMDLQRDPELTLRCLEAMLSAWHEGRRGVYEQDDWDRPLPLLRGLTIAQSRSARVMIWARESFDELRLCIECEHLLAVDGAWQCGNSKEAGFFTDAGNAGLSWELITLPQRCPGLKRIETKPEH